MGKTQKNKQQRKCVRLKLLQCTVAFAMASLLSIPCCMFGSGMPGWATYIWLSVHFFLFAPHRLFCNGTHTSWQTPFVGTSVQGSEVSGWATQKWLSVHF